MAIKSKTNAAHLTAIDLSLFFREYALLFASGITLADAAFIMEKNGGAGDRASLCRAVGEAIDSGLTLADALKNTGKFPEHAIQMTTIGQDSGRLDSVLDGLAKYYERQDHLEKSVRSALTFPLIMIGVMVIVLAALILKVLPMFGAVFQSTGAKMPLILRIVTESNGAGIALVGVLVIVLALLAYFFAKGGEVILSGNENSGIVGSLPFMKSIIRATLAGNFAYGISLMLSGGITVEDALEKTGQLTSSGFIRSKCDEIQKKMAAGDTFAQAVSSAGMFDSQYQALLMAGEKSGKIDSIMDVIASRYTEDIDEKIGKILACIEPVLVIAITLVIGVIILSVMVPLMNVLNV